MMKHSLFSIARNALSGHRNWPAAWRQAKLKPQYDIVIVGGGGHGLATAYYLAKNHGLSNIAVLEKGWIGGGNTGRNTSILRSNYLFEESTQFYDFSLRLYEGLSRELNYNLMFGQHGVLNLAYSRHELRLMNRRVNALRHQGVEAEMLDAGAVRQLLPILNTSPDVIRPVFGGFLQPRGGTCRHDAVAWGYARGASELGVEIIQNCTVEDFVVEQGKVTGVQTSLGPVQTGKVLLAVAGHSSFLAQRAGLQLPITCLGLQAMVSEPVKPLLNVVLDGAAYVSQSDRGELVIGGGTDLFNSYAQRGMASTIELNFAALLELFPCFSRMKWMRQWAGIVDYTPDHSPIMGLTPVAGLYLSGGWGSYGFKAIPAGGVTMAHTIANDAPHPLIEPFALSRFETGALIDEGASSGMDLGQPIL
jgi:sarcosine oxidase subunit beta